MMRASTQTQNALDARDVVRGISACGEAEPCLAIYKACPQGGVSSGPSKGTFHKTRPFDSQQQRHSRSKRRLKRPLPTVGRCKAYDAVTCQAEIRRLRLAALGAPPAIT